MSGPSCLVQTPDLTDWPDFTEISYFTEILTPISLKYAI